MTLFVSGLILFLGVHSISIVAPAWRERMVERLGLVPWQALYSVVAIAGFVMLVAGYGEARLEATPLYAPPQWLRHLTLLLMLFVFPLLLAAYLPGRIRDRVGHPMLLAVKIWALAHLLANGSSVDVLLFGGFLLWAVVDRISVKRRRPPPPPSAPASGWNDAIAVIGGLALYVLFVLHAHLWLFGVPPVT